MAQAQDFLTDKFPYMVDNFLAYENKQDITSTYPNILQPGSQNMFIIKVEGDKRPSKLIVRGGMEFLGQLATENFAIRSEFDKFRDKHGNLLLIREHPTNLADPRGDVIEVLVNSTWYQITKSVTDIPVGTHKYRFEKWWDVKNLQNRLVFSNGSKKVMSWTGGYAQITGVGVNSLSIDPSTSWEAEGFIDEPSSSFLVFQGQTFTITGGWTTNTLTLGSNPTGIINIGDFVFQGIRIDDLVGQAGALITNYNIDTVSNYLNHMVYGSFTNATVYFSGIEDEIATLGVPVFSGTSGLNDLSASGTYTGNVNGDFTITIDSVTPAANSQLFHSSGGTDGGSTIDITSYSASGKNVYRILVVADSIVTPTGGAGSFTDGELVVGGTSGAVLRVVQGGNFAGGAMYTQTISGIPVNGETLTGQTSGTTRVIFQFIFSALAAAYKNNVLQSGLPFPFNFGTGGYAQLALVSTYPFSDGLVFDLNQVGNNTAGDYWELTIKSVLPDTFQWAFNGIIQASKVPITTSSQLLSDGISISFINATGHDVGDMWDISVTREIVDAWKNTSFAEPVRLPGEGTFLILDAPVVDMLPQETGIYFNTVAGSWINNVFTLSADNKTEAITVTNIKSQYQNKMLANGLVNYDLNSIIYITQDKTVLSIGRLELLQEPQNKNISDSVKYDFLFADLTDGDMKLFDSKIFFTAPKDGIVFCYDLMLKIWQPPQVFSDPIGKMSIHNSQLVGHSYTQNVSYTLFTGTNDFGNAFTTRVRLPYVNYFGRDATKQYSMTWCEGYITGAPQIKFTVNRGLSGCQGQEYHTINPIMCVPPDTASLGAGGLGFHSLGSDEIFIPPKFRSIYKYDSTQKFYEANMELECSSLDQDWQLLSIGINCATSPENNSELLENKPAIPQV